MKFAEPTETETLNVKNENIVELPLGLMGFEEYKEYVLLANPDEAPFLWLQLLGEAQLSFLVVSPFELMPDYEPEIEDSDAAFLGLENPEDALVYCIVTLHGEKGATANLKGPIIINRSTLVGKQIVPNNASDYSVNHALPVAE